jgi:hypothetical protein
MTEKIITSFRNLENPTFNNEHELKSWKSRAINIVLRVYGETSKQEESVKDIKFLRYASFNGAGGGNNGKLCEKQATEIIQGFISDIEIFGIPEPKSKNDSGINISLNQNQTQNQSVSINIIWESIKDELTGKQAKEIEEIINSDEDTEEKKSKIIDRIKNFGIDVASNIVAGILTNPSIFGI